MRSGCDWARRDGCGGFCRWWMATARKMVFSFHAHVGECKSDGRHTSMKLINSKPLQPFLGGRRSCNTHNLWGLAFLDIDSPPGVWRRDITVKGSYKWNPKVRVILRCNQSRKFNVIFTVRRFIRRRTAIYFARNMQSSCMMRYLHCSSFSWVQIKYAEEFFVRSI